MTEMIMCPIHNKPLRYGKWGASCPTPVERDASGAVTKWCDFKPGKDTKPVPVETREPIAQRDYDAENRGKVRNNIVEAIITHGGLEAMKQPGIRQEINSIVQFVMVGDDF